MQNNSFSQILTVGLAIFSMLFGAGNLMYPLKVGIQAGPQTSYGMLGFLLTAICLPLLGLVAMILFDGNYEAFFKRIGDSAGNVAIFLSMLIVGPIIAIPRIVTLSQTMIGPFLPFTMFQTETLLSSFVFALMFLGITYIATFRENKIVSLLGKFISPALLISLIIIIGKALLTAQESVPSRFTPWESFKTNFIVGYETLDLLGCIFFASIVIHILKNRLGGTVGFNRNKLAMIGLKAGTLGLSLLAFIYIGMSMLSKYHGHGLSDSGNLFRLLAFQVLGNHGALIIGTAVLMACFSTSIALSAVLAEYLQLKILDRAIGYESALAIVLLLCIPLSTFGLDYVLKLTAGPIIYIGYPMVIAITVCNIAYKLWGFKPIKIPVFLTFLVALITYIW